MVQTFALRCCRSSGTAERGPLHSTVYVPNATKLYTFLKINLAVQRGFQDLSSLTGDGIQIRQLQNPTRQVAPSPTGALWANHTAPLGGSSFLSCQDSMSLMGHAALSPSRRRAGVCLTQQRPCLCFWPHRVRISSTLKAMFAGSEGLTV